MKLSLGCLALGTLLAIGPASGFAHAGDAAAAPHDYQALEREHEPGRQQRRRRVAERRVRERDRVAGREDETVGEASPRPHEVPPHRARQHQREEEVHLRARSTRVAALPVVQREVDELVDDVLEHVPLGELPVIRTTDGRRRRARCLTDHRAPMLDAGRLRR